MAAVFRQWESDPLFSAAEVVQDSADRMESIFRIFLHEQSLVQGDPTDQKLLGSVDYHRRDLATALGTTKWQLEDFERAVNLSAFSDRANMREDAISRHRQFIRAIEEQIFQVEKSLENTLTGISERSTDWMNLNEKDRDGLASFLSGGYPDNHVAQHNADSSIMSRFFDSTKASEFDEKSDEIVELKAEEIEEPHVNDVMHIDRKFDNLKKNTLRKVGSNYYTQTGIETLGIIEDGNKKGGSWERENSDSNAKSVFSKYKLRGSHNILDVFGFLSNVWLVYGGKMARNFTKRSGKDGRRDFDHNLTSSYIDIPQAEQGMFMNTMQSCGWAGDFRRGQQWKQPNRIFLLAWAVVLILFILGAMFVSAARDLYSV